MALPVIVKHGLHYYNLVLFIFYGFLLNYGCWSFMREKYISVESSMGIWQATYAHNLEAKNWFESKLVKLSTYQLDFNCFFVNASSSGVWSSTTSSINPYKINLHIHLLQKYKSRCFFTTVALLSSFCTQTHPHIKLQHQRSCLPIIHACWKLSSYTDTLRLYA